MFPEADSPSDSDEDREEVDQRCREEVSRNGAGAVLVTPDHDAVDSTNAVDKELLADSMEEKEEEEEEVVEKEEVDVKVRVECSVDSVIPSHSWPFSVWCSPLIDQ